MRFPLLDPDAVLRRLLPYYRPRAQQPAPTPRDAPVAIQKGVDRLELGVSHPDLHEERQVVGGVEKLLKIS